MKTAFMPLPALNDADRYALFFDFDGTLADIVENPKDVQVTEATTATLKALCETFGGAVAIITGRDIPSIDSFLAPVRLPVAGVHGLSRRNAVGEVHTPDFDTGLLDRIAAALTRFVDREQGLILERKHGAIALHYRQRPELATPCLDAMQRAVQDAPGVILRTGKMVVEAVGHPTNKGAAIADFLRESPFEGRIPVFVGDDLTDEDGFALVNERNGVSIKVGPGETQARYRVADREALLSWLDGIVRNLGQ